MGVVKLVRKAGNVVGWMGRLPPFTANIVGYPLDKASFTIWRASCDVDPAEGGADVRAVYGVQTAEDSKQNTGVRITGPWYDWLDEKTRN